MDIEKVLTERFSLPLKEHYNRRIIFWYDEEKEFEEIADNLVIDNVKIIKLTGSNSFAVKKLLVEDDSTSNFLVYNPLSYADLRDNWLIDIELYSEDFRADLLSIRMQELNIPSTSQMRKAVKSYSKFFENKDRVSKLLAYKSDYSSAGQLHIDILSVLAGAESNSVPAVIRSVLKSGLIIDENEKLINIRKFGNEDVFWELIKRYTGFEFKEDKNLNDLSAHIMFTALSVTMKSNLLQGFDNLISVPHQQLCYSLINEWMHSSDDNELYEIARETEEKYNLAKKFDSFEVEDLLTSECFPCINECILRKYMSEISEDVIKINDIVNAVEKRRTLKWYKRVRYFFDGILYVAQMQKFYHDNIGGFHIAEYNKLFKEYCNNYYNMDYYYRMFHTSFSKSLNESSTVLDDLFKSTADYVEKLYKNWYLKQLGMKWAELIHEDFSKSSRLHGIPQQSDFYNTFAKPVIDSGSRVYVIISDALRFEVAAELTNQLLAETKGSAKIAAVQSVFPSATKFGMAALLPHNKLEITDNMRILCDGESTEGTENRDKILKEENIGNIALTYKSLLKMKQSERREVVSNAQAVYIYHNTIDTVSESLVSEDQVFEACGTAISEIKNLVRMITNDLSGANILITADHGFLYSYKPLNESDKAEKSFINGNIFELDRRYVISDGNCTAEHMMKIPLTDFGNKYFGFSPMENIRMKMPGGGMNYVHGGVSLQECVVPVIEFKNIRTTSKKFVDVKKAEIQLVSQSRKISNSIFSLNFYQKEAVGGKTVKAEYELYISNSDGKPVSDRQKIIADKTSQNGADRMFRIRFTLKSCEFKKTDTYYLVIEEKETSETIEKYEFTIDIAFTNDFDF